MSKELNAGAQYEIQREQSQLFIILSIMVIAMNKVMKDSRRWLIEIKSLNSSPPLLHEKCHFKVKKCVW